MSAARGRPQYQPKPSEQHDKTQQADKTGATEELKGEEIDANEEERRIFTIHEAIFGGNVEQTPHQMDPNDQERFEPDQEAIRPMSGGCTHSAATVRFLVP